MSQTTNHFTLPDIVTSAEADAGFKEDIVVTEYTGQTDYCFTLYTILPRELEKCRITQDILCWAKPAALLGVMQGRDTKPGAEETSKTVLRKFPRKSNREYRAFRFAAAAFPISLASIIACFLNSSSYCFPVPIYDTLLFFNILSLIGLCQVLLYSIRQ